MEIRTITTENIEVYREFLDPDRADDIGRKYYHALALHAEPDMPPEAALIWQLKNVHKEQPTIAELTWFYAKEPSVGKELLAEFEKNAVSLGAVGSCFEFTGDRSTAEAEALAEAGYVLTDEESKNLMTTIGELSTLSIMAKAEIPSHITSISSLTMLQIKKGISNCVCNGRTGALEDLDFLPLSWFEPVISCCTQEKGKVNGFLMVHRLPSGSLAPKLLCACKPAVKQDLLHMIRLTIKSACENYSPQTPVEIRYCDEAMYALVTQLIPQAQHAPAIIARKQLPQNV